MEHDGPRRRYAIFTDIIHGDYMILVKGRDIDTAPKWGGFVAWVGGVKTERYLYQRKTVLEKSREGK